MSVILKDKAETNFKTAADMLSTDVVLTPYEPGRGLPLFIQPNTPKLSDDTDYALAWLNEKRPVIEQMLSSAGAIVLRGFPIERSIHFARFTKGYGSFESGYVGGSDARSVIVENVMSASALRADLTIDIHQEMSYLPRYPKRLAFYCRMPSVTGGTTTLCDMREASAQIDPILFHDVETKGIRYVRNYRARGSEATHPIIGKYHKIWSEALETDHPAKAETTCRALGMEPKWCEDGSLEASYDIPGILTHPRTGERIWFNQLAVFAHTPRTNPALYEAFEEAYKGGRRRPFVSTYGDGTQIPLDRLETVVAMLRDLAVSFLWSHGDILLIDNYLVGHGRTPFTGKRDVQVALLGG